MLIGEAAHNGKNAGAGFVKLGLKKSVKCGHKKFSVYSKVCFASGSYNLIYSFVENILVVV